MTKTEKMHAHDPMSDSETSSWPDEAWFESPFDHIRPNQNHGLSAPRSWHSSGGSVAGSSSSTAADLDRIRSDIRRISFFVEGSECSTPIASNQPLDHASALRKEERRWAQLAKVLNDEVQRKLTKLRISINCTSAVARLPVELLCLIFDAVLVIATKPKHIVTLTWICRQWRRVALSYPQLWTRIFPGTPVRHLSRFIRRSNGLPLDFTVSGTFATADHWSHFFEHINRCRKIVITDIPIQWLEDMAEWVDAPAPLLEELELSANPSQEAIDTGMELALFDQYTPSLRRVRINNLLLPRTSFHIFLNITHLEFAFGHGLEGQPLGAQLPSQTYILHILTCTPLLQDAVFERYGEVQTPYFRDYDHKNHPRVKLEYLKRFCVQGMAAREIAFLGALDVPEEAMIRVGIDMGRHQEGYGPLIEVLENKKGGLKNLFRVQEIMFAASKPSSSVMVPQSPESISPAELATNDKWAVHLWDSNSKLAMAIVFKNPTHPNQTETMIWALASTLFKKYKSNCLAWSNFTGPSSPSSLQQPYSNRLSVSGGPQADTAEAENAYRAGLGFINSAGIYIRVLLSHTTITDLAFDNCQYVEDALKLIIVSESSRSGSGNRRRTMVGRPMSIIRRNSRPPTTRRSTVQSTATIGTSTTNTTVNTTTEQTDEPETYSADAQDEEYEDPHSNSVCPNLSYLALLRCRTLSPDLILDLARIRDSPPPPLLQSRSVSVPTPGTSTSPPRVHPSASSPSTSSPSPQSASTSKRRLRKLKIHGCPRITKRAIMDLRWLVDHVEWDGDRRLSTSTTVNADGEVVVTKWGDESTGAGDSDSWSVMADLDPDEERDLMDFDEDIVAPNNPNASTTTVAGATGVGAGALAGGNGTKTNGNLAAIVGAMWGLPPPPAVRSATG